MKRTRALAYTSGLVLAGVLSMSACTKQELGSTGVGFAGDYVLVSVDGTPVPASVSHEGAALQVRWGSFTINADGTCSSKTIVVPPSGTEVTREVTATYTKDGSRLIIQWKDAGMTVGTIQGDTFTMDNEGMILVYRK